MIYESSLNCNLLLIENVEHIQAYLMFHSIHYILFFTFVIFFIDYLMFAYIIIAICWWFNSLAVLTSY
jgi:hypothetical protein